MREAAFSADGPRGPAEGGWLAGHLQSRFGPVMVVVSPPRCGSTVVARSLWRHPRFHWYVHEPFDQVYHRGRGLDSVRAAVSAAVAGPAPDVGSGRGVVVKEMTFQAGLHLPELMDAATHPVLVTVRDPRLAVRSRMRQREKAGQDPCFPPSETGWADLVNTLAYLRENAVPHVIADVTELRRRPHDRLPELCDRLGLPFAPEMLSWPSAPDLPLGGLGDEQRAWYARVLTSTGFEPPVEETPGLASFPAKYGMRDHLAECLEIYRRVLAESEMSAETPCDQSETV